MIKNICEKYERPLVVLLLVIFFISALGSMMQKSSAVDEVAHLTAGYTYWKTGNFKLNEEHPPLIKLLAAAPLLIINPELPLDSTYWTDETLESQWKLAREFLFSGRNDPDQLFFWARIPMILIGALLGVYIYLWAKELYGTHAALLALLLYAFSPDILGQTIWVHTDMGVAAGVFITTYYFWKFLQKQTWKTVIILGILLGLTNAVKFTGVYLIPIFAVLGGVHFYYKVINKDFKKIESTETEKYLTNTAILIGIMLVIGFTVLAATYFFVNIGQYFAGLSFVIGHSQEGNPAFLFGEFSKEGWWYYFIAAFLVKTPLVTIILMIVSLLFWRRIKHSDRVNEYFLIIPAVLYFIAFMLNEINIGVRHILPVYPFIFVFVSKLVNVKFTIPKKEKLWQWLLAIFLGWYILSSILVYPHYSEYFNELVGGPNNGQKYLLDSNIDWGQDTRLFYEWLVKNNLNNPSTRTELFTNERTNDFPPYNLYRFNTTPIKCQPSPGIIAISVNKLYDLEQRQETCVKWLRDRTPFKKIGYSIFIYNITDPKLYEQQEMCKQKCTPSCATTNQTFSDFVYKELEQKCLCVCR